MDIQATSPSFYRALMMLGKNGPTPNTHTDGHKPLSLYDLLANPLLNHPAALHAPPSFTTAPEPVEQPQSRSFASLFGPQETPYG